MAAYVPYIVLAAGIVLVIQGAMINASGMLNGFLFRIIPLAVGAATLFAAALLLVAGA